MADRTIFFLPDMQFPYQDQRVTSTLLDLIVDIQPDEVVQVGDFVDLPEVSRWTKGYAQEHAGTILSGIEAGKQFLTELREVFDGPFRIKMGNHDERIERYVSRYAPALAPLPGVQLTELLDLKGYGATLHRDIFKVAPGWVCAHGHEGALRAGGGLTALALARKVGQSVVCGHTHSAGLVVNTTSYLGQWGKQLMGMEVGHAMNQARARYMKGGADWQNGFGLLHVRGARTYPELVLGIDRRFSYRGVVYGG